MLQGRYSSRRKRGGLLALPPLGLHRTATPTVRAFSEIQYACFQGGLLIAIQLKQMGCNTENRCIYGSFNDG